MKNLMKHWLASVVFCLGASLAFAEGPMTLDDCLSESAANNPDLAASLAALQKAGFDVRASYADLLPQVNAEAGTGKGSSEQDDGTMSTKDSASVGVSASQSLFTGGKNRAAVNQASANRQAALASLADMRATLSYNVRKAFADLLYAQEQIELARSIAKRRADNLALIQLRYEGGRENKGALLLSQASSRDAEFGVAQAERYVRVAQRQLARVLGRGETDRLQVNGKLDTAHPPADADFAALAAETPAHLQAAAQLLYARAGLKSAKSTFYPDLSANASASENGEDWMPDQEQWFLGLTLSYPLFSGGRNLYNVRGAGAEVQRVEANLRATDAEQVLVLERALNDFANAVDETDVQSAYVHAAEVRAEIGRTQYASGMMSFEDWDRIENDLITNQKQDLSARRDAVLAEANWDKVQGKNRLPPE